ncbi:Retrovirus-related Pol polyprotein from transposon RE1 [Senna tora]|uniref:Retrovirus-related Pol polyprotein from transposon RE1 n=1 Tax=Senna tora TaxID=362788 RepID=A0A835C8B3_9FABA|nr:Retrovirus-related Pol polyprotein from transposon RE1 [Senna tora]
MVSEAATSMESTIVNNTSNLLAGSAKQGTAVSFNHPISVKLDDKNFLLWRQQVYSAIQGHDLEGFVTGVDSVPEKYLTAEDRASKKLNPEHVSWKKQDKLLFREYFAAHIGAKVHQYKLELRNMKKGTRTMQEYLLRIKALVDAVISVGSVVSAQEHIDTILFGLCGEYDAFVTRIRSRRDVYYVFEIESLLLAQEARIEQNRPVVTKVMAANVSNVSNTNGSNGNNGSSANNSNNNRGRGGRQGFNNNRGGRGRGGRNNNFQNYGHAVNRCYRMFDQAFNNANANSGYYPP